MASVHVPLPIRGHANGWEVCAWLSEHMVGGGLYGSGGAVNGGVALGPFSLAFEVPLDGNDLARARRGLRRCCQSHGLAWGHGGADAAVDSEMHHRLDAVALGRRRGKRQPLIVVDRLARLR